MESLIVQIHLHASTSYNQTTNKIIISSTIDFIIQSKRYIQLTSLSNPNVLMIL